MIRTPGIGPRNGAALLERFGRPENIFAASAADLSRILGERADTLEILSRGPDIPGVEADLDWLAGEDRHLITRADPGYPPLLGTLADPPLALFVHGDPAVLQAPQLAIVGSRNPSPAGRENAVAFARAAAHVGLVITSGLALGIDGAAHQGALDVGGATIAVAGTGLDRVYPARHRELAHRIAAHGALVSELPSGSPPLKEHFPRRNRILSGLALGTLVVEAAVRSGSLITARLAAEQGREVFAIPGSIHSPLSRGCHALIRDGAKLVETLDDIVAELGPLAASAAPRAGASPPLTPDPDAEQLLKTLGYEPVSVEILVERTGLTAATVSSMLLQMELNGLVAVCPGGSYVRVP